jgi:hypothetical protein
MVQDLRERRVTKPDYSLKDLLDHFSDYEQRVQIVCCWHGRFKEVVKGGEFEHFPSEKMPDDRILTPDFLVKFNEYTLVGELCRLPNQTDGFAASVEQARSYLSLGSVVDVLLLLPHDTAGACEKRMQAEGLLADDEQVLVVSYVRNDADRSPIWVFAKATTLRTARFRDAFLQEHSLDRLFAGLDTWAVPIRFPAFMTSQYPFMNDPPPALYTACYLWQFVFSVMHSQDEYVERGLEHRSLFLENVTAEMVRSVCDGMKVKMKASWARDALRLLADAGLATTSGDDRYAVSFRKLRRLPGGSDSLHEQLAERLAKENVSDLARPDHGQLPGQMTIPLPSGSSS